MERLATGDTDALGELYDRHQVAIRRFLSRMSGNAADVEDTLHATFLEAFRSAKNFDGARSVRAWLLGIAANLFRRSRSQGARWSRILRGFSAAEPAWSKDPERTKPRSSKHGVRKADLGLRGSFAFIQLVADLASAVGDVRGRAIEIHAGGAHAEPVLALLEDRGATVQWPQRGHNAGQHLAWYVHHFAGDH